VRQITICTIAAFSIATGAWAQTYGEKLEALVTELPRNDWGGAMYWMEMKSVIGWEKMMLVFGYADNSPVCERLAAVAYLDAPDREFRCSSAN
jgi:hypothetical protein